MSELLPDTFLQNASQMPPKERLEALVAVLRGPHGCPWDQKQNAKSIINCVIDEAHELKDALEKDDQQKVIEELGDLAFTFTFLCQTLQEKAWESNAVDSVVTKMVARHPHVFCTDEQTEAIDESNIKRQWEHLKTEQQTDRRLDRDLPASLPAWKKAKKILTRAHNTGFRYPNAKAAWEKVTEEWGELFDALESEGKERQEAELGDVLLALLTASLESGLDGERALEGAGRRLADRLEKVEELSGRPLRELERAELVDWYTRARDREQADKAYFNYCGVSPWPGEVTRAVSQAARAVGRHGLSGALALREQREQLRHKIGALLATEAESVVLVPNVSSAGLAVGYCLDWQPGDTILLGRGEFPANHLPWRLAAKTFGLRIEEFDDDLLRSDPEQGWQALQERLSTVKPRLFALSVVSFWSGYRVDIERLAQVCQEHSSLLYLDAIQALGVGPVKMADGVSFLAGGSHKTLLSPEGAGFLAVSPSTRALWVPRLAGWLGLPDPVDFLTQGDSSLNPNSKEPRPHDPSTFEGGSQNALGYAGLSGALDYLQEQGVEKIAAHIQSLHDILEPAMVALGFVSLRSERVENRSSILSFAPPPGIDLPKLQQLLSQAGIETGIPKGVLRFGFHKPNRASDIEHVLQILPKLLEQADLTPNRANFGPG